MNGPAVAASLLLLFYSSNSLHGASQVQGQTTAAPTFEVASVKPSNPDPANPLSALPLILPGGAGPLTATNIP